MKLLNKAIQLFGYEAVKNTGKRKAPVQFLRSEDKEFQPGERRRLVATSRDLVRNMSQAQWAVNKHVDYVASFSFKANTGVSELDDRLERLVSWWSRPENCDVSRRFGLDELIRFAERARTVDGDVFIYKLSDGRLQLIEGDCIRTPTVGVNGLDLANVTEGIRLTKRGGAPRSYIICDREANGNFVFLKEVRAEYICHHGYFNRYGTNQIRGVSPIASAINTFQDIAEAQAYALAKAKISQLFGLKFTSKEESADLYDADEQEASGEYVFDFNGGPQGLNLPPGVDADILESAQPSAQFQSYMAVMTEAALKSLDIPYSFYAENYTNFSGSRQTWIQYQQQAEHKRKQNQRLLNHLTEWRIGIWIEDGIIELPAGMRVEDLRFEWVGTGTPWIDPLKEVTANLAAVRGGLDSPQRICKARGVDWFDIIDEIAEAKEYAAQKGITLDLVELTDTALAAAGGEQEERNGPNEND